jgi:hypothetical protein
MKAQTNYHEFGLNLSEDQIEKIKNASTNGKRETIIIRLKKENLHGDHKLPLTHTQINRIQKSKTGLDLKLSPAQLGHVKTGGFLPLLLAALPFIFGGLGAAGSVAGGVSAAVSAVKNARAAADAQRELERHNQEIENEMKKSGSGVVSNVVGRVPVVGKLLKPILERMGLGINDCNQVLKQGKCTCIGNGLFVGKYGSGLYIGPQVAAGNGLFLGPERR